MLRGERTSTGKRYAAVVLCVLAGIAFGVWHNRREAAGLSDPISSAGRAVTVPLASAFGVTRRWLARQTGWLVRGRSADAENRRLAETVRRLTEENARLREAEATALRLRKELGFPQSLPQGRLAADVVAFRPDPHFDTLVISRGSRDRVRNGSVVVCPEGLVGQVYNVAPSSAAVMLLTDSNAAAGAMIQRADSRAAGIVRGNRSGLLSMEYVERGADVRVGDVVISSGMGGGMGVFPKGLTIGTIGAITDQGGSASRRILVQPAVNFGRLEEVYVLP